MSKVLLIVEGEKREPKIMKHLFEIYGLNDYTIVSYKSNIYSLYNKMFVHSTPDELDILQVLKEMEQDVNKRDLLSDTYSDIILIFDFDPQDTCYSKEKIIEMQEYFHESSDMGQLYINYPNVESYYYQKTLPDKDYNSYDIAFDEIKNFKHIVGKLRNDNYHKYAQNREECNILIKCNINKANKICCKDIFSDTSHCSNRMAEILQAELKYFETKNAISILCTCVFYIYDYNKALIDS